MSFQLTEIISFLPVWHQNLHLFSHGNEVAGVILHNTKDIKDKEALKTAKAQNKTQLEILQSQEVAVNLQEALTSGAANAEQIEKRRSAVLAKIANLRKSEAESDKETARKLENTFRLQDQNAQAQLAVLKERDKLLKTFSAEANCKFWTSLSAIKRLVVWVECDFHLNWLSCSTFWADVTLKWI